MTYDGEIWHADAYRPCPRHLLGFISKPFVVTKNDIFKQKYLNVNKDFAAGQWSYSRPTGGNSLSVHNYIKCWLFLLHRL